LERKHSDELARRLAAADDEAEAEKLKLLAAHTAKTDTLLAEAELAKVHLEAEFQERFQAQQELSRRLVKEKSESSSRETVRILEDQQRKHKIDIGEGPR